ncbi:MAG: hypothetical protein HY814_08845 [Candidatus Riflebacteria bacterium]|nr:hypothetical protein [Candidatus Riflebacteria bacterium]
MSTRLSISHLTWGPVLDRLRRFRSTCSEGLTVPTSWVGAGTAFVVSVTALARLLEPGAPSPAAGASVELAGLPEAAQPRAAIRPSFLERNPMGLYLERVQTPQPPPPSPQPPPPSSVASPPLGPVKAVGLKLLGTMACGELGAAIIQEPGGRSDVYRLGQDVKGRTLVEVRRRKIVLRRGPNREELEIPEDALSETPPGETMPSGAVAMPAFDSVAGPEQPALPLEAPLQSISRELPREEVVKSLGNPASFLSQVSAEPYYENGRFSAYYLQDVKPGSYAASLGIRAGDVLETVNGELVDTVQKSFRLLGLLQRAPEIDVVVRRGGERMQMCYRLQ